MADTRQEYRVESLHEPVSHYTDAVRWGDLLFVSGVSPLDKDLKITGEDITEQTEQVFRNMKAILDAAGATFADVLKVTVYMIDVEERRAVNEVRKRWFGDARPASTLIGVRSFVVPEMKIEIEAVVGLRNPPG